MSIFSVSRTLHGSPAVLLCVVVAGVPASSSAFAAPPSVPNKHGAQPYSYGGVTYSKAAVRTPFGVAARGTAYAASNGPIPKSGYSYGAVKYGANAVKTPSGVMDQSCHRTAWGISCI